MKRRRPPSGLTPYETLLFAGSERRGECLLSLASPHSGGYRYIQLNRKTYFAHRVAYETWVGDIPPGNDVDHVCHNEAADRGKCFGGRECWHRSCWNPAHLRAVNRAENLNSSSIAQVQRAWRSGITHCPRDHEYTEANTRHYRRQRACRACAREKARERRAKP